MTEQPRRRPGFFGGEARSDSSAAPVSLWRFVGPRYWRVWVLIGWLKLVALLPRRASLAFHRALGRRLGRASASATRLIRKNLATCFPELNDAEREAILDEYLANMGAIVAELAIAWFHPPARLERLFDFAGTEHLSRALEGGRGVILVTGHFTPIELCTLGIKRHAPYFALMYNQRRSRLLSE
ncbi:MAG: hypothetical protein R3305_00765, partial [Gammaproteobacteria bacterium]|nr:hypothetical protein [Gammaproteobacteria bacterium]